MTEITAKCCGCGYVEKLTDVRIKEANDVGCLMCDKCYMPMEIKKVKIAERRYK